MFEKMLIEGLFIQVDLKTLYNLNFSSKPNDLFLEGDFYSDPKNKQVFDLV